MKEIWKDIIGYEDYYQVSNFGQIKSKYYNRIRGYLINSGGYATVQLCVSQKRKAFSLHRIVGLHFIHNSLNLPQINHKDCNKLNNHVDNLEWCTSKENCKHRSDNGLSKGGAKLGNKNAKKYCT